MTAHVLVNGTLFRAPEQRTSKTGKPFVSATLKCVDGETLQWWKVVVFSESAQAELMRLGEDDALSAQGAMTAGLYTPIGGETKLSFSLVADQVLALRQPTRERKPKDPAPAPQNTPSRQDRCAGSWAPGSGPSDDIPF
jgi:hypothetical protein